MAEAASGRGKRWEQHSTTSQPREAAKASSNHEMAAKESKPEDASHHFDASSYRSIFERQKKTQHDSQRFRRFLPARHTQQYHIKTIVTPPLN
mmetsp:Transcript_8154/g.17285  ORF Transcript_8154/g.17285 Transcript_8154/m.17285 type:complete len:93 (+) Transcript_8154:612-890(+)